MHTAFNEPHICFLIEASSPGLGHVFYFRIDQAYARGAGKVAKERIHNQVAQHLNYLHNRTGLNYDTVYWSDPVRFTRYIKENSIELS